jgi:hypothetical protein
MSILAFSAIPASFGNFYLNSFKIINRFEKEAIGYIIQGVFLLIFLGINHFYGSKNIIYYSIILLVARVIYMLYGFFVFRKGFLKRVTFDFRKSIIAIKTATPFGVHLILGASIIYIDTFILSILSILENVELLSIPDTLLCEGDSVQLTSSSLGSAKSFSWSTTPDFSSTISTNIDSILTATPLSTTSYYVRGRNSICFDTDTIVINVEQLAIEVNDFESFCIYDTISLDAAVIRASSPLQYSWTPLDSILTGANLISATIAPKTNQFYFLKTVSQTGCEDFDTVEVEVNLPAFDDAFIF